MRGAALVALLFLAACKQPLTVQEQAAEDERDIAMVERANSGTGVPIAPQPILLPDMQAHALFDPGCAFAARNAGLGAVMLAQAGVGYMKLNGEMIGFAADRGAQALPYGVYPRYNGKGYAFELSFAAPEHAQDHAQNRNYDGRLRVEDARGHIVYDQQGTVQCSAAAGS